MVKYVATGIVLLFFCIACSFTQKVQTGLQAYEVKQFSIAVQLFEKEYTVTRNAGEKAQIAYLTGDSFLKLNNPAAAADWYIKAYKDGFGPEALEQYAGALKRQEKYEDAILAYEELMKASPANSRYRSSITLCRQAIDWKKNANQAYEISPVAYNSTASEYAPQPIGPGLVLFTSDRDSKQNTDTYLWTGRGFSDLYISNSVNQQVTAFDHKINSSHNEGAGVISPDGNVLVFTRCYADKSYDAWCKLMISYKRGKDWSEPQPLTFTRENVNYGHPAFTADGSTLFFASDAPEGHGGHDIYFTQPDGQGRWSEPVNLGAFVNTMGDELYPTVYQDTLYFASDYHAGLGGLDIFKTYPDINGQWVPPINLQYPVNSGGDDFGFAVDTFATLKEGVLLQGYFTTTRGGATQHEDIYAFSLRGVSPADIPIAEKEAKAEEIKPAHSKIFLALMIVEPVFEIKDDPNSKRIGKRQLPNGPVIMTEGVMDQRFVTDGTGQLLLELEWNKEYTFTARYRDHLAASYTLNTAEVERNKQRSITTVNHTIVLDPIFRNMEIELENIFYDYDEWFIRDDAKPSLDKLAQTLKSNPSIRIQLSSHTDCRGTEEYNIELSQKRAQAAVDYLVASGIQASRLVAQGFGEAHLAVRCICESCTEDQHQTNRRTTFTIVD